MQFVKKFNTDVSSQLQICNTKLKEGSQLHFFSFQPICYYTSFFTLASTFNFLS